MLPPTELRPLRTESSTGPSGYSTSLGLRISQSTGVPYSFYPDNIWASIPPSNVLFCFILWPVLSSCASTLPMKTCSSSLYSMFSSWSRRSTTWSTSTGCTSSSQITRMCWTWSPTNLWTSSRSLMRRAGSPRLVRDRHRDKVEV